MINVEIRLRRAIRLNDLVLVRRIVRNNPHVLRNPDFEDKSNTSLHLAAREGFTDIAVCRALPAARPQVDRALPGIPHRRRPRE